MFSIPLKKRNKQKKDVSLLMFPVCKTGYNNRISTNMIVEIYSYESGIRCIDKKEYSSIDEWEKDLFILKISGTHVGYRRYDEINMAQFNELSETEKNNLPCKAEFDKEAYISKNS